MADRWKELELFNTHQEDSRKRTEFLAKAIFLISGGALSLSINLFLGEKSPKVPPEFLDVLRYARCALFASMAGYVLVFCVMLIRDYCFGELWRKKLNGEIVDTRNNPGWPDKVMWILGVLSVLSFLFGLGSLAYVFVHLIGHGL